MRSRIEMEVNKIKNSIIFCVGILLVLMVLSACTKEDTPSPTNDDKEIISLEQVVVAIQNEIPDLVSFGIVGDGWNVNDVQPEVYSWNSKSKNSEGFLYIYVFNSKSDKESGLTEIKKWDAEEILQIYEKKNIIVVYRTKDKNAEYKARINDAVEKM